MRFHRARRKNANLASCEQIIRFSISMAARPARLAKRGGNESSRVECYAKEGSGDDGIYEVAASHGKQNEEEDGKGGDSEDEYAACLMQKPQQRDKGGGISRFG